MDIYFLYFAIKRKEKKMDIYFLYFARKKKKKMNNIFFCKRNQKGMKVEKEKGIQLGNILCKKKEIQLGNILCKKKEIKMDIYIFSTLREKRKTKWIIYFLYFTRKKKSKRNESRERKGIQLGNILCKKKENQNG